MAGHKILVIDDSKVIRVRVKEMLPQGNFNVIEAKDGQEGLKFISKERPNLIMLDFLLPKVTGWEVFQKIQSQSQLKKIPLVLMSGRKEEVTDKIPEPFEKHFFAFLEKPFEKKELTAAIKLAFELAKIRPSEAEAMEVPAPEPNSANVKALQAQVKKMQNEIVALKKQMAQLVKLVTVMKQKLK
ncbi:MAG: response regulator [Okeania sp. SIO3H1]|uniref:response regulator n=1 Tax=Okeania sp. SIO1I7 TaxID=2607772 RepID=UPI0013CC3749|nr:response regulator [Okeania sp. SIO1I7]NEN89226.1 response regulator [Okeania sp. SIO3H1]NET29655.1 response regulator [Okeania sp. SIO1I7]